MAKVKGLFGTMLRGSVGNVTFRKHDRKNVASQKVSGPNKSSTPAQIYQRAIANTTMQAYSTLKSICDHSFQGVQYGALSMSHFLSVNNRLMRNLGVQARYLRKGLSRKLAPVPFIISEGTLPSIDISNNEVEDSKPAEFYLADLGSMSVAEWQKITPREFMARLRLDVGDQLSFVAAYDELGHSSYQDAEEWDGNLMRISLSRYVFAEDAYDKPMFTTTEDDEFDLVVDPKVLDSKRSTIGSVKLVIRGKTVDSATCTVWTWIYNTEATMSVGAIASRKSSNTWLRSSAQLEVQPAALSLTAYVYDEIENTYILSNDERILNYENPMKKLNASGGEGS